MVVYESEYGNTERIAYATAEALSEHGEACVTPVGSVATLNAESLDLLVVGAPPQRHGSSPAVKDLLKSTPRGALAGVRALAFGTNYRRSRWITGRAAREIAKLLRRKGCKRLAEPESYFMAGEDYSRASSGEDTAGSW